MTAQDKSETSTNVFSQQPHLGVMHHEDLSKNFDPDQREKCRQGCNIERPDGFQAETDVRWLGVIFNSYLLSRSPCFVRPCLWALGDVQLI